jgi:aryl-alcohol dehydrogenase-like predicted oxidoreductase
VSPAAAKGKPRRAGARASPGAASSAPAAERLRIDGGFPLGETGRVHPPIGLGLWAMGRWDREHEPGTFATLDRAIQRGVPWVDTAEVYGRGRSERLLGDYLAEHRPSTGDLFVTTKVSWEHLRPDQTRAAVLGSLQRLGGRAIDLYLLHAPDPKVPVRSTLEALAPFVKDGRIRAVGVSNFTVALLEEAIAAAPGFAIVANQVLYNLFERREGDDVLDFCRRHRIVVESYTPLCRGFLAGRYLDGEKPDRLRATSEHPVFSPEHFPEYVRRATAIRDLAEAEGVPMASLALHWLRRQGTTPVVGASRPEQVDDLVSAWNARPSDAALARAEALARGAS